MPTLVRQDKSAHLPIYVNRVKLAGLTSENSEVGQTEFQDTSTQCCGAGAETFGRNRYSEVSALGHIKVVPYVKIIIRIE
jgi:hypothetical protein